MSPSAVVGQSTIVPCLRVQSIPDELHFLEAVFGVELRVPRGGDDAALSQIEVQLGNASLMLRHAHQADASAAGSVYVKTDDVDATCQRAVDAGATLIDAPNARSSGVHEAGFRDPQGNVWWIGQKTGRLSNREVDRRLTQQRRERL